MLRTSIMVVHVLLAVSLVLVILIQRGKGAEVGTAFGAGASGTVFGARGSASFLTRATAVMATLFFVTSLSLAFLSSRPTVQTSIMDQTVEQQPADGAPAALAPPAAPVDEAADTGAPEQAPAAETQSSEQPTSAPTEEPPPER